MADIQRARKSAHRAAANKKIYIAGGVFQGNWLPESCQCEVYDETTNEWQFVKSFFIGRLGTLLAVHGKLDGLSNTFDSMAQSVRTDCYDPEENKWTNKTNVRCSGLGVPSKIQCSMRIFKGLFNIRQEVEVLPSEDRPPEASTAQPLFYAKKRERKCSIV